LKQEYREGNVEEEVSFAVGVRRKQKTIFW
jgi:hypothetical protein